MSQSDIPPVSWSLSDELKLSEEWPERQPITERRGDITASETRQRLQTGFKYQSAGDVETTWAETTRSQPRPPSTLTSVPVVWGRAQETIFVRCINKRQQSSEISKRGVRWAELCLRCKTGERPGCPWRAEPGSPWRSRRRGRRWWRWAAPAEPS